MKLGKLSLVAVMALGTSVYALDDIKVDGEAKLWYQTSEFSGAGAGATTSQSFFDHNTNSSAEARLSVGASAKLLQNISGAVKMTALSTLGLENNLVGAVPAAKYNNSGALAAGQLNDQAWMEVANLKYAQKEFDVAMGRMALQTPLCFTESWNVVDNTFEAAVAHGYFLPDTILAAAWVGKHNGVGLLPATGRGTTVANGGAFSTFGSDGAYAFAAINKSVPNTTFQGWYYNVPSIADAYWLQADTKLMGMIDLGAQFAGMMPKLGNNTVIAAGYPSGAENLDVVKKDSNVLAVKAAVDVSGVNVYAAYSKVSTGTLGFANVATGDKTMLYTGLGSVYMDGEIVAAPDTKAFKVGASTKMVPGVTLSTSYCSAKVGANSGALGAVARAATTDTDFSAWDVVANTKVGMLDLTAIYTSFDKDVKATDTTDKTTDTLRIIASLKF
ncbi:MAG: hypothetical protein PHW18_06805 [Sulfuricurvum sp.]|uniref:hypothetical protein n=1 Tax=Sulfuricurvum sp. TaxID=2025608 RepID=UPI0026064188|nr:hypothetical protein [Sulfuricurvum sp.]MDD2829268.1 hypothetical protein [Sulfuricurvum sp.]MDD4949968.1 hypothetical protein [Sulfuricurvum sp.]